MFGGLQKETKKTLLTNVVLFRGRISHIQVLASLRSGLAAAAAAAAADTNADHNNNNDDDDNNNTGNAPPADTRRQQRPIFPIGRLDELVSRHARATQANPAAAASAAAAVLAVTGRHRELVYALVATLIAAPHEKAVAVVDLEGRFDPLRLLATAPVSAASAPTTSRSTTGTGGGGGGGGCSTPAAVRPADLDHVHLLRPPPPPPPPAAAAAACGVGSSSSGSSDYSSTHVAEYVGRMEEYMLYGAHRSRDREWWGTVVVIGGGGGGGGGLVNAAGGGGSSSNSAFSASSLSSSSSSSSGQVAVTAGWRGWLRVDRAEVPRFWGMSAEEALAAREERQAAVEAAGWVASSPWGDLSIGGRERDR